MLTALMSDPVGDGLVLAVEDEMRSVESNLACTSLLGSWCVLIRPISIPGREDCRYANIRAFCGQGAVAHDGVTPCPTVLAISTDATVGTLCRIAQHSVRLAVYFAGGRSCWCAYLYHISSSQYRRRSLLRMHVRHLARNPMNRPTYFPATALSPVSARSLTLRLPGVTSLLNAHVSQVPL
jgi:hypothetical protein